MKNIEKYYDAIKHKLQTTAVFNLHCIVNEIRTGCDDCPKGINCRECCLKNIEWLNQEYKQPILTQEEKDIIRHFMEAYSSICSKIVKVIKTGSFNVVCLKFLSGSTSSICSVNCVTISPEISKDVMFKGMVLNKEYTLEELGLENVNG